MISKRKEKIILNRNLSYKKSRLKKALLSTSVSYELYEMIVLIAELHRWSLSKALGYLTEIGLQKFEESENNSYKPLK